MDPAKPHNPSWRLEEMSALHGFTIEWMEPAQIVLSKRNKIYVSRSLTGDVKYLIEIPAPQWKKKVSHFSLGQRLLRFSVYNVIKLDDGSLFVTFDREMGRIDDSGYHPIQDSHGRQFRVHRGYRRRRLDQLSGLGRRAARNAP